MNAKSQDKKAQFASKKSELIADLESWFEEESASIDDEIEKGAPAGTGGSIVGVGPAIDSKRVLDATHITKKILDIDLPPEIIKPGGYGSCEEMIADILPKLEAVYLGEIKVKKQKLAEKLEPA